MYRLTTLLALALPIAHAASLREQQLSRLLDEVARESNVGSSDQRRHPRPRLHRRTTSWSTTSVCSHAMQRRCATTPPTCAASSRSASAAMRAAQADEPERCCATTSEYQATNTSPASATPPQTASRLQEMGGQRTRTSRRSRTQPLSCRRICGSPLPAAAASSRVSNAARRCATAHRLPAHWPSWRGWRTACRPRPTCRHGCDSRVPSLRRQQDRPQWPRAFRARNGSTRHASPSRSGNSRFRHPSLARASTSQ